MIFSVAVTGENNGKFVTETVMQNLCCVGAGVSSVTVWSQGCFINLKNYIFFHGSFGKCVVINRKMYVIAMSEDFTAGCFIARIYA